MSITAAIAIGTAIAGLVGTAVNANENKKNRKFNAKEAQKQRNWEEKMSNTAVQRQVADMEAAGINPAMAYGGGSGGASTPTNSAAQASGNGNIASNLVNSAANLAAAFNMDKNPRNDVTLKQINTAVRSYGYSEQQSQQLTDDFFNDLYK